MKKVLKVYVDPYPQNPLEWFDLGTVAYKHSHYKLGTEVINDPIDWLEEKLGIPHKREYTNQRLKFLEDRFLNRDYIGLPLYLYDHSGITISTTPFSCPFDSGQVGYIYTSKENIREIYGYKQITQERRKHILRVFEQVIHEFDMYIRGEHYGFVVEDENGDEIESNWGYIGADFETNGLMDDISPELHDQLLNIEAETMV